MIATYRDHDAFAAGRATALATATKDELIEALARHGIRISTPTSPDPGPATGPVSVRVLAEDLRATLAVIAGDEALLERCRGALEKLQDELAVRIDRARLLVDLDERLRGAP